MNHSLYRDRIVSRLIQDLVGPMLDAEVLSDRPTQRYSTGILYPRDSQIMPEEDEDGGLPVNIGEEASIAEEPDVSLHASLKPSSMGFSFAVRPDGNQSPLVASVEIRCATYDLISINDTGEEVEEPPDSRARERWRRKPHRTSKEVELGCGESKYDLAASGMSGLELYLLVTPHAGLFTVTAALSNRRSRGESREYDERQHFFQVELLVRNISHGTFAPRPSLRAETDEESRAAALI